ncbi:MAG: hypothetical protein ACTSXG_03855 [Alphaproteobacteria bacterium]
MFRYAILSFLAIVPYAFAAEDVQEISWDEFSNTCIASSMFSKHQELSIIKESPYNLALPEYYIMVEDYRVQYPELCDKDIIEMKGELLSIKEMRAVISGEGPIEVFYVERKGQMLFPFYQIALYDQFEVVFYSKSFWENIDKKTGFLGVKPKELKVLRFYPSRKILDDYMEPYVEKNTTKEGNLVTVDLGNVKIQYQSQ